MQNGTPCSFQSLTAYKFSPLSQKHEAKTAAHTGPTTKRRAPRRNIAAQRHCICIVDLRPSAGAFIVSARGCGCVLYLRAWSLRGRHPAALWRHCARPRAWSLYLSRVVYSRWVEWCVSVGVHCPTALQTPRPLERGVECVNIGVLNPRECLLLAVFFCMRWHLFLRKRAVSPVL